MSDKSERQFSENSGAETIPDIPVALPAPTTPLHMFPSQSLSTASRIIRCRTAKEERYFVRIFCLSEVCCFVKVPGRGLEPLRIAPPDPKSGASANFATLASTSAIDLTKIVAHRRNQRQISSGNPFTTRLTLGSFVSNRVWSKCRYIVVRSGRNV